MYPIDNAAKALFAAEKRQVLRITGIDPNGNAIEITEADVKLGTFAIDRYCCNGGKLEVGTAVAAEMKVQLNNTEGTFDNIIFEGTELYVEIGIADWENDPSNVYWLPCGYFTPVEQPRRLTIISINALDRMATLDRVAKTEPWTDNNGNVMTDNLGNIIYFEEGLSFPCTIANLIEQIGGNYIPCVQDLSGFPNSGLTLTGLPTLTGETTVRDIIQWCAGVMGANAYVDWNGNLCFAWYDNATGYSSTTANRYNSDLYENAIVITGVEFTDPNSDNNTVYLAGTDTYTLDLSDNCLINAQNANTVLQAIYTKVHDFAYTPFSAAVVCAPYLWPMDRVTFTDKDGTGHVSSLTNVNFGINGTTAIASTGETTVYNKALRPNPFTARQENVLRNIQHLTSTEISSAVEDATAQITGAEGGYVRFIYDANDKLTEIVIMDTEDITTATKVWRWNSGGLGYSSNGYAGPYTTAITQNGAIVADFITAGSMSANRLSGGTIDGNTINAKLLNIVDANGNVIASFNDTITIGKSNAARAKIQQNLFSLMNANGGTYFQAGNVDNSNSVVEIIQSDRPGQYEFNTLFSIESITSLTYNGTDVPQSAISFSGNTITLNGYGSNVATVVVNYTTNDVIASFSFGLRKSGTTFGYCSVAEGYDCEASGKASHSEGYKSAATDDFAHSEGHNSTATGIAAHSEGFNTTASGDYSHAEGRRTTASGGESHAEGYSNTASGDYAHTEGIMTQANSTASHAEGWLTHAYNQYAHSEGYTTTASGEGSHSEGEQTTASGDSSHAEGSHTTASGGGSHSEGINTTASGGGSHAEGYYTIASGSSQHVSGKYNISDNDGNAGVYAEIVGNGTSGSSRSNARTLDWSGNEWIAGALSVGDSATTRTNLGALGTSDVVNNLTSTSTTAPLSANMGKNLYDRFRGVTDTYAVGPTTIELNGCYPAIVNLRESGGSGVSGLIFVANGANCYGYNLGAGVDSVSMNGGNLVVNVPSSSAYGYSIIY